MSDSENEVELDVEEPKAPTKAKKVLSPEHLEKLKIARELAQKSKLKSKEKTTIKKENEKLKKEKELADVIKANEKIKKELNPPPEPEPEPEPVKKKRSKKKVIIQESSSDSDSDGGGAIYIKKSRSKKKYDKVSMDDLSNMIKRAMPAPPPPPQPTRPPSPEPPPVRRPRHQMPNSNPFFKAQRFNL